MAAPWRTLQKAADSANPGDLILVRGGVYTEFVVFSSNGTAANPIVFRAYPSETPIVDGSSLNFSNLPEDALFELVDVDWITLDGFELRNLRSSQAARTPKGIFVAGACEGIEILNCRIHDIENNSTSSNGNAHGIAVYGWSTQPITGIRIEGCELFDLVLGASEALVLNGNVTGFEVIGNHVHDCNNIGIDFIGYEGLAPSAALDRARNGVCRDNLVHDINTEFNPAYRGNFATGGGSQSAAGIYVDGGAAILIERNTVHHCNIGIELASEHANRWTERIEVRNNVVFLNDIGGLFLGGYNAAVGGTRDCVIRHNSFYQNDVNEDWNGEIYFQHETENNVVTHNILFANSNGLFIGNPATSNSGNVVNWNLFHAPSGADLKWQWKGTYHEDFASYRSGTGNDADSSQGNPLYISPGSGDLRLQPGSPAIDSGDPAFTPAVDERDRDGHLRVFNGRVDRGAFEFGSLAELPAIELQFIGASETLTPGDTTPGRGEGTDFGYVDMAGAPVTSTLLIRNPGSSDLDVSALNLSGPGFGDFSLDPAPGLIAPGSSAMVNLVFDPTAVAEREATIEVVSDAEIPSFSFAIRGFGTSSESGRGGVPVLPVTPEDAIDATNVPFDPALAGVYSGPVPDRSDDELLGRFASLRLNRTGAFTAVLFLGARRSVLRGRFEGGTPFTGQVLDENSLPIEVVLTLQQADTDAAGWRISATLDGASLAADAGLVRSAFHGRANPSPWTGRYTLLLPPPDPAVIDEPEGTGWAVVFVAPGGNARASGQLGDGTNFSTGGFISADGEWFFFQDLYRTRPRGQIGGWLRFRQIAGISDLDGDLEWRKLPDPRERRYADGFQRMLPVIGCAFTAPDRGEPTLDELVDQDYNAQLSLVGTQLPGGGIDRVISWSNNDRLVYYGPERLVASVNRRKGMLRGLYWDRDAGRRLPFRGVVYQVQGIAAGCFTEPDRTGYVMIEPGTAFPYPGSETRSGPLDEADAPASPASGPARTDALPAADNAGAYSGLLEDAGAIAGSASFRMNDAGAFTAVFQFQGQRLVLRDVVDPGTGAFTGQIPRRNNTPVDVSLQLQMTAGSPPHAWFLSGTISADGVTADLNLHRSHYHARREPVPEPTRGRYTALLPAGDARANDEPHGDGIALVDIAASGRVRLVVKLGDGIAFARGATLFANGEIPIFVPLYGRGATAGSLGGELRVRDLPDVSDFDGTLRWEKGANARDHRYPGGFNLDQPVIGSKFTTADRDQRLLNGYTGSDHNGWIRFEGASLAGPGPIDEVLTWFPGDRVAHYGPERLVVRINRRNGYVNGIFDDRTGFRAPFRGVIFQEQDLARGHFLEPDAVGRFRIDPR